MGTDIVSACGVDLCDHDVHVVRVVVKRGTHHVHIFSATVVPDIARVKTSRVEANLAVIFFLGPVIVHFITVRFTPRGDVDVILDVRAGL